ncbi:sensor histidine kinase [Streptomyces sp. NPDC050085]|uniref:sensor histidine kinase n=1 Tax=Streptomyces sp. NPDC050085 TaxID=3365600 RepID=UPI0037B872C1
MNRSWLEPAFDSGFAVIRALVLAGVLIGDVLLLQPAPTAGDLVVAGIGVALCLVAGRWVFGALLAQSGLLVVADALGASTVSSLKVLAAVTLFELALRRSGRPLALGAAALALAVAANRVEDLPAELLPVLYKMGIVAGLPLLLGSYVRVTRDAARRAHEDARQQELRTEEQLSAARAAERAAIARELHDLVAHHVSSMVLRVGVARHVVDAAGTADPRITQVLDDLHSSGSAALADLRGLVTVLRAPHDARDDTGPLVTPGALRASLETVVERSVQTGLGVTACLDPGLARLDAVRGQAVLRLVQESLANAARHGGPGTHAELVVQLDEYSVRVTVEDDGAGRAGPTVPGASGHGLIGMRERVHVLGGRLDAAPAGLGWRVTAQLPLPVPQMETQQ